MHCRHTFFALLLVCLAAPLAQAAPLNLPPETPSILDHIYSGRPDLAIPEAVSLQKQMPENPLGYLLEAEALWWEIWCSSAEFKYGMTMARHRDKVDTDQRYIELALHAEALASLQLHRHDSAEMHLYAGLANALLARLYGLRWETRTTARAGVTAREHFVRALALDPSLADADMGLGLYDYYVDTLSTMARVLRFVMGIPGGSKQEGITLLDRAMQHGQLTPSLARFYLAINLHNYDQRYEDALRVITPLAQKYPQNPLFQLVRGDLLAKLGRKPQALECYRAAQNAYVPDEACRRRIEGLVQASLAAIGVTSISAAQ